MATAALIAFMAAFLAGLAPAEADTVGALIDTGNNHWGTGGNVASPVVMTTHAAITPGVELVIEPGTEILFATTLRFDIAAIRAVGTCDSPIVFRPATDSPDLRKWCEFQLYFEDKAYFAFCRFAYCSFDISDNADSSTVEHCILEQCFPAAFVMYNSATRIVNNTFIGDPTRTDGIWLADCAAPSVIRNNILTYFRIAFWCQGTTSVDSISYNMVAASGTAFSDCAFDGTNTVDSVRFVDTASGDYRLAAGSAAIDAGDPADDYTLEPDCTGGNGGINLGAYGNTPLASCLQGADVLEPDRSHVLPVRTTGTCRVYDISGRVAAGTTRGVAQHRAGVYIDHSVQGTAHVRVDP
jgi:hypothetical protein